MSSRKVGQVLVGAVADDDTGMTDLCGMFTRHGVNAVMFFENQPQAILREYSQGAEVIAIGTRARTMDPRKAYRRTREAVVALKSLDPKMYYLKYCSTFDSTPKGNIGQMIDAGLDIVGGYTIAVPALPVNGRTTYMGNHFVLGVRMDRSPMRNHPLTPMIESDLVKWLSYQTKRQVGLADYNVVRKGSRALRENLALLAKEGKEVIIVDAISQRDLRIIDEATWELKLVTGGSGLAMELPPIWRREGLFGRRKQDSSYIRLKRGKKPLLVVAGSVSIATRAQNQYALRVGFRGIRLNTLRLMEGKKSWACEVGRVSDEAGESLSQGENVLVYSAIEEADISNTKDAGYRRGMSDIHIGDLISEANGEIVRKILYKVELNKLAIAGGETAGAVGKKLSLIGLHVGQQIHPGVPICFSISKNIRYSGLTITFKSGNFGRTSFYEDAFAHMRRYLRERRA